jgi:hypothetical protein
VREDDELQEGKIYRAVNIPFGEIIRKARHGDLGPKEKQNYYILQLRI